MSIAKSRLTVSAERFFEEPGEAFALADSSGESVYVVEKKRTRLVVCPVVEPSPRQLAARKAVQTRRKNESTRKRARHLAAKKAAETRKKNKEAIQ
ncbi:MAG TPA: hypothetical protein VFA98_01100 [Thermoanaerobaculia bacterium]|jgi:hypothetical protein|nr:hypothetical protein [Thermoanaerobaculia bacterium]